MSGPKLIELRRMRAAMERQRNHDRVAASGSEYARLFAEFQAWGKRLAQLGVAAEDFIDPPERVRARIDTLLGAESHHEAARLFGEAIARLRQLVDNRRGDFEQRFATLQNRHRQWLRNCETLAAERARLAERLPGALPAGWPDGEKERLRKLLEPALTAETAPNAPGFPDTAEAMAAFEKADAVTGSALAALRAAESQFESALTATRARLLAGSADADAPASPSLTDVLKRFTPPRTPAIVDDPASPGIDRALAELAALAPDEFLANARRKADAVRAERDPARRRVLFEGLSLEIAARRDKLRESARQREQARQWIDSAAHLDDPAVNSILAELRRALDTGGAIELAAFQTRLPSAVAAAEERREREQKRRALIDSLQELGYQTNEGLETALVRDGRLVLRRAGEDEYAVEVVANPELNQLQTALVRYADRAELTEQQKRRDREREETWCADHAKLREKMAARGWETPFKMQLKPGEHPVKVIVDATRAAAERARPVENDLKRQAE